MAPLLLALALAFSAAASEHSLQPLIDLQGEDAPPPRPKKKAARTVAVPGIHPVYPAAGGWLLFDRSAGKKAAAPGQEYLVVGSEAAGFFTVGKSSMAWGACMNKRPVRTKAFFLMGKRMEAIGTPIIAIRIPAGARPNPRQAKFYRLENEIVDATYEKLEGVIRKAVLDDVQSGDFFFLPEDSAGESFARDPEPKQIQLKIDFGSRLRVAGFRRPFIGVEGIQISKTYRRCMRLYSDGRPVGACAEMPHALLAETNLLAFVAYDPSGSGRPFVLAYTPREPLWGHERWGFQMTRKGPRRFLMDALDPKCRERF